MKQRETERDMETGRDREKQRDPHRKKRLYGAKQNETVRTKEI